MPPQNIQTQNADRLLAMFERQDDQGLYYFADEDVRHFLPLLALTMATESGQMEWPPATRKMMDQFVERLNLPEAATAAQLSEAVDAYYATNPVDQELRNNFQLLVRELFAAGNSQEISAAASKLLGMAPQTLQPKDKATPGVSVTNLLMSELAGDDDKDR